MHDVIDGLKKSYIIISMKIWENWGSQGAQGNIWIYAAGNAWQNAEKLCVGTFVSGHGF